MGVDLNNPEHILINEKRIQILEQIVTPPEERMPLSEIQLDSSNQKVNL